MALKFPNANDYHPQIFPAMLVSMYYLLYEHDHSARGQALAGANSQLIDTPVKAVHGMTTLTFWGHGTSDFLCGKTAPAIAEVIKSWKRSNSGIKTVEILTCNSRHALAGSDPFVLKLKRELGFRHRKLAIKSMPIRMGPDGMHGDSILFASSKTSTWCYVTAKSERFHFIANLFRAICENDFNDDAIRAATYLTTPPPRRPDEGPVMIPFQSQRPELKTVQNFMDSPTIHGWSIPISKKPYKESKPMTKMREAFEDDAFRRKFIEIRKYTMNYGGFDQLRNQLVTIR